MQHFFGNVHEAVRSISDVADTACQQYANYAREIIGGCPAHMFRWVKEQLDETLTTISERADQEKVEMNLL